MLCFSITATITDKLRHQPHDRCLGYTGIKFRNTGFDCCNSGWPEAFDLLEDNGRKT
jgi:hypothetical protein